VCCAAGNGHIVSSSTTSSSSSSRGSRAAHLVSGGRDKTVRVWSLHTGQCVYTFSDHSNWVRQVCFHPASVGGYVLSCSDDRSVRVFDLKVSAPKLLLLVLSLLLLLLLL
jgi:WD40 repeat protein